jgi:hypothetical protein
MPSRNEKFSTIDLIVGFYFVVIGVAGTMLAIHSFMK